jgi:ribosomal protein S21
MIPIKIRADEDVDDSYKKLKLIFENNGKSFESVPRIIYITKDEKINSQYDYDDIMGS